MRAHPFELTVALAVQIFSLDSSAFRPEFVTRMPPRSPA
jgi:hypothetical protein